MNSENNLQKEVMMAAREQGISSVLFRNALGRKLGLNVADIECLSLVSLKGTSTPTEIARYTGLTTGSTTAMLDRLEKAHFISRKPNPKDRRGILIEINETYMQAVRPCISSLQKAHTNLFTRYSDKELKVIVDFLTRFADNVKESTEAIKRNS